MAAVCATCFAPAESVEPRHQRVLQTRGDGERITARLFAREPTLKQIFGQLLDEQGNAVCILNDAVEDFRRQAFAAGDVANECGRFAPRQSVQRHRDDVRLPDPWRRKLRPERHDHQHGQAWRTLNYASDEFERSRIRPLRVFEDQ